jgi:hypothetical protein
MFRSPAQIVDGIKEAVVYFEKQKCFLARCNHFTKKWSEMVHRAKKEKINK